MNTLSRAVFWTCAYVAIGVLGLPFLAATLLFLSGGRDPDAVGWLMLIVGAAYFLWCVPFGVWKKVKEDQRSPFGVMGDFWETTRHQAERRERFERNQERIRE